MTRISPTDTPALKAESTSQVQSSGVVSSPSFSYPNILLTAVFSHWSRTTLQHRQAIFRPSSLLLDRCSFTSNHFLSQKILYQEFFLEVYPLATLLCWNGKFASCCMFISIHILWRALADMSQTGINYTTAFVVSLIFNKIIKSRYKHWCKY